MDSNATAGVVIPAYNCALFIREALESLEKQTVKPDIVIVVDDGSTDRTASIVEEFQAHTALKIDYHYQSNRGIAAARNVGVGRCNTKFVAFLDGDDVFYPEFMEKAKNALLAQPKLVLCFSDRHIVDENRDLIQREFDQPQLAALGSRHLGDGVYTFETNPFITLVPGNVIPIGNLMLAKTTFDRIGGFDEDLRVVEDRPFLMTLAKIGPFGFLKEPLGIWRRHESSTCGAKNAFKMQWYANLGLEKLAAKAEALQLREDEIQAIKKTRDEIPSRLMYAAAQAVDPAYFGIAVGLFVRRRIKLPLLFKSTMRYCWRFLAQQRVA